MRKKIKFLVLIVLSILSLEFMFAPTFVYNRQNKGFLERMPLTGFDIMKFNVTDKVVIALLYIFVISLGVFFILNVFQIIRKRISKPLYFTSLIFITISFLSFLTCGLLHRDMCWGYYVIISSLGLSLIISLLFEYFASKGF